MDTKWDWLLAIGQAMVETMVDTLVDTNVQPNDAVNGGEYFFA